MSVLLADAHIHLMPTTAEDNQRHFSPLVAATVHCLWSSKWTNPIITTKFKSKSNFKRFHYIAVIDLLLPSDFKFCCTVSLTETVQICQKLRRLCKVFNIRRQCHSQFVCSWQFNRFVACQHTSAILSQPQPACANKVYKTLTLTGFTVSGGTNAKLPCTGGLYAMTNIYFILFYVNKQHKDLMIHQ